MGLAHGRLVCFTRHTSTFLLYFFIVFPLTYPPSPSMFLFDVVRKVIKRAKTNIGAERLHVLVWLSHSTSVCIGVQNCKQNDSAKRFYRTNITVTSMFEVRMVALRTIAFNHCQRSIYMPHEKYHDSRNKLESKNRCVHRSCY